MKKKYGLLIIILFILSFGFDFYNLIIDEWAELMLLNYNEEFYFIIGMYSFIALFINIIKFFFIIGIYLTIKLVNKKIKKEKLSKIDFQKYDGYFRDILNNYDVAVLSYIDDFELDYPKDIVAVLLNLKNKGKISFDEINNIIIVSDKDIHLSRVEKYLLNNIINGKVKVKNYYTNIVVEEAKESNLLKSSAKPFNFIKFCLSIFVFIISNVIIFNLILNFNFENNPSVIIFFIIIIVIWVFGISFAIFFLPVYGIIYLVKKANNPYVRSDIGDEVNIKLEGLKNYLKDFSSLDEKHVEELVIWEDYLIYSVLFNQNKIIIEEIYEKYFEK